MLSERAKSLWGKSDREKGDGSWHPAVHHMLDVTACAEAILGREPPSTRRLLSQDFGCLTYGEAKPWILFFIASHDLGKASPSFQYMWLQGAALVQSLGLTWRKPPQYVPHGLIGQIAISESPHLRERFAYDWLRLAADAVGCHHGLRVSPSEIADVDDNGLGRGAWEAVRGIPRTRGNEPGCKPSSKRA